jgi:hypothetical protein
MCIDNGLILPPAKPWAPQGLSLRGRRQNNLPFPLWVAGCELVVAIV